MFDQAAPRSESSEALAVLDGLREHVACQVYCAVECLTTAALDLRGGNSSLAVSEAHFTSVLTAAQDAAKGMATWDPAVFTGSELCSIATQVEKTRRFMDATSTHVLAELDARGFTDSTHGMRTAAWLAREASLSNTNTKNRVRTANKLQKHFPKISEALTNGDISYEHAKDIINATNPRIINQLADLSEDILGSIPNTTYEKWKQQLSSLVELLDQQGGHRPGDAITDNILRMHRGLDNTLFIDAQLTGSHALSIEHALNCQADQLFKQLSKDSQLTTDLPVPDRKTLLALALSNLSHPHSGAGSATGSGSRGGNAGDTVAGSVADTSPTNRGGLNRFDHGSNIELAITVNSTDTELEFNKITDHNNQPLNAELASYLTCNPTIYALLTTNNAATLNLTRTRRLASRAQRRALTHRDGGCVFPGCTHPPQWTDAHHLKHWNSGGVTDLSNLASLCRYHHMVTHRKGWNMTATPDYYFIWTTPNGTTLTSQRHQQQQQQQQPAHQQPAQQGVSKQQGAD